VTAKYIDIKEARNTVVNILKEYGTLNYSRLLMFAQLPEDVLEKVLEILVKDKFVEKGDEGLDPSYRLTSKGRPGFWPFTG
jgi:predicted transcriptional regulator